MSMERRRRRRPPVRPVFAGRLVPDDERRLGEGFVRIKAGITARLLGIRLLRLDADVVLAPVRAESPPAAPERTTPERNSSKRTTSKRTARGNNAPSHNSLGNNVPSNDAVGSSTRRVTAPAEGTMPTGGSRSNPASETGRLAAARLLLQESEQSLAHARKGLRRT